MHKLIVKGLILFSLSALLFACGGGGDTAVVGVSTTRMLQAGDSWVFDFSGQGHTVSETYTYTGTATMNLTQETLNTETVLAMTDTETATFSSGSATTITAITYLQQDQSSGDIRLYGMLYPNSTLKTVTDQPLPVIWPGSWEAGKTNTAIIHYSDGTTDATTYSYTIMGAESVATPAGTFATWKYVITSSGVTRTYWFSPQLGFYVKIDITDGTDSNSYTLRSTNVLL
ncbi:MAG: hypothetical protein GJT30_09995 [Geobacter sp.]|nr:hypothetical protein [Geobacter sp.]